MTKLEKSIRFVAKHYKPGVFNPDSAWEKVTGQPKRILFRLAVWRSVAAVAVVLIAVGTIFIRPAQERTILARDIQTISVLPDTSKITLEPGASLAYAKSFGKENRTVRLTGDARFEVSRNEEKPFTVQTSSAEITVLGTVFDVSSSDNATVLQVKSGKVRFEPTDFPVSFICTQSMKADFDDTQKQITVSSPESSCTINQTDNLLKFNNIRLEEVCRVLTQYFGQEIDLPESDKNNRLTSTFQHKNVREIVDVINLTLETEIRTAP